MAEETLFDLMPHVTRWCGVLYDVDGTTVSCELEHGHDGEHTSQPLAEFGGPVYTWTE